MTTRDAILDGAWRVMRTRGLAGTTTKEIARAAGYSEATLYKLFSDKVDLFLSVLSERLPRVGVVTHGVADLAGTGAVAANLERIVSETCRFYAASFPLAMSLFSDPALLARHRAGVRELGAGPEVVVEAVRAYLRAEQSLARVGPRAPVDAAAMSLVGACFHRAFLLRFADTGAADRPEPDGLADDDRPEEDDGQDPTAGAFAAGVVASVLPALVP